MIEVNPHWHDDRLWIAAHLEDHPDMIEKVSTVTFYSWSWTEFSETRWCKVRESGAKEILSLTAGWQGMFEIMQDSFKVSNQDRLMSWDVLLGG